METPSDNINRLVLTNEEKLRISTSASYQLIYDRKGVLVTCKLPPSSHPAAVLEAETVYKGTMTLYAPVLATTGLYINAIKVVPSYRGLGFARCLLHKLIQEVPPDTLLMLDVLPFEPSTNASRLEALYRSAGFVKKTEGAGTDMYFYKK